MKSDFGRPVLKGTLELGGNRFWINRPACISMNLSEMSGKTNCPFRCVSIMKYARFLSEAWVTLTACNTGILLPFPYQDQQALYIH